MLTILISLILFFLVLKFFPSLIIIPTLALLFTFLSYWLEVNTVSIIFGLIGLITVPSFIYYLKSGGATKLFEKHPELSALCNPKHESTEILISPANPIGTMVFVMTMAIGGLYTFIGPLFLISMCSAQ